MVSVAFTGRPQPHFRGGGPAHRAPRTVGADARAPARPASFLPLGHVTTLPCRLCRGPVHKPAQLAIAVLPVTSGQREPQRQRQHQPLRLRRCQRIVHPLCCPEPDRYWPWDTTWGNFGEPCNLLTPRLLTPSSSSPLCLGTLPLGVPCSL